MAVTVLTTQAKESSTLVINIILLDEDDNVVTPNEITYTLTDNGGAVINSKKHEPITPAASMDVVLTGADLALDVVSDLVRVLTIEGTYNSSAGNDLAFKDRCKFYIEDLVAV